MDGRNNLSNRSERLIFGIDQKQEGTASRPGPKKKELNTRNKGRCLHQGTPALALDGPASDARLPLPLSSTGDLFEKHS
jgi:hypothetical protein